MLSAIEMGLVGHADSRAARRVRGVREQLGHDIPDRHPTDDPRTRLFRASQTLHSERPDLAGRLNFIRQELGLTQERFTSDQATWLLDQGCMIFELTEKQYFDDENGTITHTPPYKSSEAFTSQNTEIAIDPKNLIAGVRDTSAEGLEDFQRNNLHRFNKDNQTASPKRIIGNAADYAQLAEEFFIRTGKPLFKNIQHIIRDPYPLIGVMLWDSNGQGERAFYFPNGHANPSVIIASIPLIIPG